MSQYVIVGAGAIGTATAQLLADAGHHVRVATRRGTGPVHERVELVAIDATDTAAIAALSQDADAVFNCANPPYHRWPDEWPPIANSLLQATATTGAVLVTLSNLYAYGRVDGPLTTDLPLSADYPKAQVRARMWCDARDAHEAGRVRATEVRASDFIGLGASSAMSDRVFPRVLTGKKCSVIGRADVPHSWTFTGDVARTLATVAARPEAWGRAWHVPTNAPRTQREVIDDIADVAGVEHVKVSTIPTIALRVLGLFNPVIRELPATVYQFTSPFVIDDAATRSTFGLDPTPWREVLARTIASYVK